MHSEIRKKLRLVKSLHQMSIKDKWIVAKATLLSALFRFLVLFIPFRKLAEKMGTLMMESAETISEKHTAIARRITGIVLRVSRNTPWESKCLIQALTAQFLLKDESIPSTLYLGIAKAEGKLIAHAWLRSGADILIGGAVKDDFKCIAYFGVLPQ